MKISYSITNDSCMVIVDGKSTVVRRGAANFNYLVSACINNDEPSILANLTIRQSLADWAKGRIGFNVNGEAISYLGVDLPESLCKRIVAMAAKGESPVPFFNFWERVQKNPSYNSVNQLWDFLNHCGIPLTPDGHFLAYKSVRSDFKDHHSGRFDNKPGSVNEMPRNQVSDDPLTACHEGFHVGALEYASTFSGGHTIVVCKVDPEHVVSVPKDYSCQKMRVCKYVVEGHYVGQLSDTVHAEPADESDEENAFVSDNDLTDSDLAEGAALPKKVQVAKKWAPFQEMSSTELLAHPIETLRQYAHKGLQIVGASKIPGGKVSLISRILAVREAMKGQK